VRRWRRRYQLHGQKGLENQPRKSPEHKPDTPVAKAIIDLKKQDPAHGAKRISDILKRFFLIGANASTVQRTLHENGMTHFRG
jgi:transposase